MGEQKRWDKREHWQDMGRQAALASLNPWADGNCARSFLVVTERTQFSDDFDRLQRAVWFAWGWIWEAEHFREDWIGVPPEERNIKKG